MKIACIYQTDVPHSTGEYIFRGLKQLGHEVDPYHHSKVKEIEDKYDLYFITDSTIFYDIPKWSKPSIYYAIDTHLDFWNRFKMAQNVSYVAMAQYSCGVKRAEMEQLKAIWMPLGCDNEWHKDQQVDRDLDVAFIGTLAGHDKWRSTIKQKLLDHGIKNDKMYIGGASHLDIGKIYSRAKVVLNNSYCDNKQDINMRVFEAMCSGAYLLTQKLNNDDMDKLFDKDTYDTFSTDEEMFKKLDNVLSNYDEYKVKAKQAQEKVLNNYIYSKNLDKLLNTIKTMTPNKPIEIKLQKPKILILTALTYYNRAFSLTGVIKAQIKMFLEQGHEVGVVVAKGMDNIEHLRELPIQVYEAIDKPENTLELLRNVVKDYDYVFTHDFVWIEYMQWENKIVAQLEDEFTNIKFIHHVHSSMGSEALVEWRKGRNKPNVLYAYPNEADRQKFADYIRIHADKVITTRFANDFIEKMGGDEDLYHKLNLYGAEFVGFYPAHPMPGKNVPAILQILQGMKRKNLKVKYIFTLNGCGGGKERERLESYRTMVKHMGIEDIVVFMPDYAEWKQTVDYETVQKIWKITNLFIMPSISETTSLVLLEAMAHKCLILANDLPVFREILGNNGCAIYHKFGSHFEGIMGISDDSINNIAQLIVNYWVKHNGIYAHNYVFRRYNRRAIYKDCYLPLFTKPMPIIVDAEILPKISVVIPIMNTVDELVGYTKQCINTVRKYINTEIILVNNFKDDKTDYKADKVIINDSNVGVSRSWNQGLYQATGDYIMILNSDVFLPDNWAEKMLRNADKGIVFPFVKDRQKIDDIVEIPDNRFFFDTVHGCCFLAGKKIFNKIGSFDERFFAYYEDRDYWQRAVENGIHAYRADLEVEHKMNATSGKMPELGKFIEESAEKFKDKWGFNG